jgi:transcriptional regulator with XRE-family HTH domain
MIDGFAGKRTGERILILRERKGLTRPVLAGLVGMSPSWLKGIERGTPLPPRLPMLVKLAEALAVGDIAVLAGTDMDLGDAHRSFRQGLPSRLPCPNSGRSTRTARAERQKASGLGTPERIFARQVREMSFSRTP